MDPEVNRTYAAFSLVTPDASSTPSAGSDSPSRVSAQRGIKVFAIGRRASARDGEHNTTAALTDSIKRCKREVGWVGSNGTKAPPAFITPSMATMFHFLQLSAPEPLHYHTQICPHTVAEVLEHGHARYPWNNDNDDYQTRTELTDLSKQSATRTSGPTPCMRKWHASFEANASSSAYVKLPSHALTASRSGPLRAWS